MSATYTLSHVTASSIKEDVDPLLGHELLWRVECENTVVAYCVDKSLADRIASENLYSGIAASRTGNLFSYPSRDAAIAVCVGVVNKRLMDSD